MFKAFWVWTIFAGLNFAVGNVGVGCLCVCGQIGTGIASLFEVLSDEETDE